MGKPIDRTVKAALTYSRQLPDKRQHTINLLVQLEKKYNIKNLSKMKDPAHILKRIHESKEFQEKSDYPFNFTSIFD